MFSTAVRAVVLAKLVILGILSLTSFILALRAAVLAKLVILGISPTTSFILALRVVLVVKFVILGILSSIFLIFDLIRSISHLSTLDIKLPKSIFLENFDVSTPATFFKSAFVA